MGIKERREREKAEIREKILEAARDLFVNEGFEAVSMRKIADRIEYSPTAIYLHFKDKEAVLRELCDADFLTLAKQFRRIAKIADPIERMRQTGLAYAAFAVEFPNHYRLMFMTPHPHSEPDDSALEKGNPEQDAYAFLKSVIAECIDTGRLRPELQNPDLVAQVMWAGVHGIVSLHIAKCNDHWVDWCPSDQRVNLMIDALIRGLARVEA